MQKLKNNDSILKMIYDYLMWAKVQVLLEKHLILVQISYDDISTLLTKAAHDIWIRLI